MQTPQEAFSALLLLGVGTAMALGAAWAVGQTARRILSENGPLALRKKSSSSANNTPQQQQQKNAKPANEQAGNHKKNNSLLEQMLQARREAILTQPLITSSSSPSPERGKEQEEGEDENEGERGEEEDETFMDMKQTQELKIIVTREEISKDEPEGKGEAATSTKEQRTKVGEEAESKENATVNEVEGKQALGMDGQGYFITEAEQKWRRKRDRQRKGAYQLCYILNTSSSALSSSSSSSASEEEDVKEKSREDDEERRSTIQLPAEKQEDQPALKEVKQIDPVLAAEIYEEPLVVSATPSATSISTSSATPWTTATQDSGYEEPEPNLLESESDGEGGESRGWNSQTAKAYFLNRVERFEREVLTREKQKQQAKHAQDHQKESKNSNKANDISSPSSSKTSPSCSSSMPRQRDKGKEKGESLPPQPQQHREEGVGLGDWNERFQSIVGELRAFDLNTPLKQMYDVNRALIHLAQDFIYSSCSYGRIIISEAFVPPDKKTIRPTELGGIVGGEKYIVHNILFKFALDARGLYRSDYAAAKVAGHELKGLMACFNALEKEKLDLCLPIMALIDYRGFRLIAMSVLPINRHTIVYGSNDYGRTVHAKDAEMNRKMKRLAEKLNIKGHKAGVHRWNAKFLHAPADLEGHKGSDGRFYLLDFSRVFPPEFPKPGVQMAHLFRLLRPEFVREWPKPLCSDAFSGFIKHFDMEQHNEEIKAATRHLISVVIPSYADILSIMIKEARQKTDGLENFSLTEALHSKGINIRYLGMLRRYMTDIDCKTLLLVEMCARIVKTNLRLRLRERMRELKLPLEEPYHRLVIDYLNLIIGHSDHSEEYWTKNLKISLMRKFELALTPEEAAENFPLKSILDSFSDASMDGKLLLFNRVQKLCGLKFSRRVIKEFSTNKNFWSTRGEQPLDYTDMEEMGLRVKHMNIISHAQGMSLYLKGNMLFASNPINAERFFKRATEKFEEVLSVEPNNSDVLCYCAEMAMRFMEGSLNNLADIHFSFENEMAQRANSYYLRAITANPMDSFCCFQYAQFLDKCSKIDEAEEFYLRSLEIDPTNVACLQEYGNFLTLKCGNDKEAERFFLRSSLCTVAKEKERIREEEAKKAEEQEEKEEEKQQQQVTAIHHLDHRRPIPHQRSLSDDIPTAWQDILTKTEAERYKAAAYLDPTSLTNGSSTSKRSLALNATPIQASRTASCPSSLPFHNDLDNNKKSAKTSSLRTRKSLRHIFSNSFGNSASSSSPSIFGSSSSSSFVSSPSASSSSYSPSSVPDPSASPRASSATPSSMSRHGSPKDFAYLLTMNDKDFERRAREEIDLVSSPTLLVSSEELTEEERLLLLRAQDNEEGFLTTTSPAQEELPTDEAPPEDGKEEHQEHVG
ncbi:Clu domain-containing protein [Balamuthia mandrillaris]